MLAYFLNVLTILEMETIIYSGGEEDIVQGCYIKYKCNYLIIVALNIVMLLLQCPCKRLTLPNSIALPQRTAFPHLQ